MDSPALARTVAQPALPEASPLPSSRAYRGAAIGLMLLLAVQLWLSVRQQSQTTDEAVHLFAGYQYWSHRDFGANPEHPPLAKLVAAFPLLFLGLKDTEVLHGPTKSEHELASSDFLFGNSVDADTILFAARVAVSLFALLLAGLVFLCAYEMLGPMAALVALALFALEPNILAHGALITTDMGAACFVFASVYAFYRYVKQPGAGRLWTCGAAVALALASKHSAVIVIPLLALLAAPELLHRRRIALQPSATRKKPGKQRPRVRIKGLQPPAGFTESFPRHAGRWASVLVGIVVIACMGLWGIYSFRYAARPEGAILDPPLSGYIHAPLMHGRLTGVLPYFERFRLLPESYLWGMTDVTMGESRPTFLLGRVFTEGQWFYFPLVFAMKSTLALLALLAALPIALWKLSVQWRFLLLPPAAWLGMSMLSGMNIGVRHILPVFPFLIVVAAGCASVWMRSKYGKLVVGAFLLVHAASSLLVFPNYMAYANEAIGGPSKAYLQMSDSNVDWGQGLKQVAAYLERRSVKDCWIADRNPGVILHHYNIPCRPVAEYYLDAADQTALSPVKIEGTVLVGAFEASGQGWGPGELNPYREFFARQPDDLIAYSTLVFQGSFDVTHAVALNHARRAQMHLIVNRAEEALEDARLGVRLAPGSAETHATLCWALREGDPERRRTCDTALAIARRVHPDFQFTRILASSYVALNYRP